MQSVVGFLKHLDPKRYETLDCINEENKDKGRQSSSPMKESSLTDKSSFKDLSRTGSRMSKTTSQSPKKIGLARGKTTVPQNMTNMESIDKPSVKGRRAGKTGKAKEKDRNKSNTPVDKSGFLQVDKKSDKDSDGGISNASMASFASNVQHMDNNEAFKRSNKI